MGLLYVNTGFVRRCVNGPQAPGRWRTVSTGRSPALFDAIQLAEYWVVKLAAAGPIIGEKLLAEEPHLLGVRAGWLGGDVAVLVLGRVAVGAVGWRGSHG